MPRLRGHWLKYEWAVAVSIIGALMAISSITIAAIAFDRVNSSTVSVVAAIGVALTSLVSALKSTETADTAAKTTRVVSLTASKIAAYEQVAEACPAPDCPMKHITKQGHVT